MSEVNDGLPESQIGRAQWLADELALCGHEDISAIDILDALASIGLRLMPDLEGMSSHEYMASHKSVIRSAKADQNGVSEKADMALASNESGTMNTFRQKLF